MSVGNRMLVRLASLKYVNGNEQSCCKMVGGCPDWMITCAQARAHTTPVCTCIQKRACTQHLHNTHAHKGMHTQHLYAPAYKHLHTCNTCSAQKHVHAHNTCTHTHKHVHTHTRTAHKNDNSALYPTGMLNWVPASAVRVNVWSCMACKFPVAVRLRCC